MIKESLKNVNPFWPDYKYSCGLILLFCFSAATAQVRPDAKKPVPVFNATRPATAVTDIREKLVQLALQNPSYELADRKVSIAGYQLRKAKGNWLSSVAIQGNFNEYALKRNTPSTVPGVVTASPYFPKYNFGISLPFNLISDRKNEVKIAKENLSISQAEKNQHFREIKMLVLSKYEDYLLGQQKLDFQTQVTQDARTIYLSAEKEFQEGSMKQEEYNKSFRSYQDERTKQAEYVHDLNIIKLQMESMIGISIDELLKK